MAAEDLLFDDEPRDGELSAVERQCFDRPWGAGDYARLRSNPLVCAWVMRGKGGAPHASVCFQLVAGEVEIFRIGVVPKFRRSGHARELLQKVLQHAGGQGAAKVFLEVRAGNSAARRLYDSVGFRQVGMREGYFQNPREDALIFGLTPDNAQQSGKDRGTNP